MILTTMLVAMLMLALPVLADDDDKPIRLINVTGNPESCERGVPVADITVAYDVPGEITLVSQAYTEVFNETQTFGTTTGGGQLFGTVIDAPTLPENSMISYTFTNGDPNVKVGVMVNCTTGDVYPGGTLGPDGRFDAGDDMPLVIYPRLDAEDNLILDFYVVTGPDNRRGRLLTRVSHSTLTAVPENPEQNTEVAVIGANLATLYRLTDGRWQLNLAPDAEGKVKVVRFTNIPPTQLVRDDFEPPR